MAQETNDRLGSAISAERALLASLMIEHDSIAEVSTELRPADFANPAHRDIYAAILSCWEARIPPDFVNVDEQLAINRAQYAQLTDLSDIITMTDYTAAYVHHYAQRVKFAKRFRVMQAGVQRSMTMLAENADLDPVDAMQTVVTQMLQGDIAASQTFSVAALMPNMLKTLAEEQRGIIHTKPIPTPFGPLTKLCSGGFRPGDLILLAARPSMGKTAMALQIAAYAALYGQAMFISLEMDTDSVMRRMLSTASQVPFEDILLGSIRDSDMPKITHAGEKIAQLPLVLDDGAALTVDQIRLRVQKQQAFGPVSLVVIDYLEFIGDENPNEERRLSGISRKLKMLAKELQVAVVLLSQLSREVERHAPFMPRLSHLRWSGSLEADADKILFLYREDYYDEKGMLHKVDRQDPDNVAQVILAKNRNGKTGRVRLYYNGPTMTFGLLATDEQAIFDQPALDVAPDIDS